MIRIQFCQPFKDEIWRVNMRTLLRAFLGRILGRRRKRNLPGFYEYQYYKESKMLFDISVVVFFPLRCHRR